MKLVLQLFIITWMTSFSAVYAKELNKAEASNLLKAIDEVQTAYESGNTDYIIKTTHPVLFKLTGGKEAGVAMIRQLVTRMSASGVSIESSKHGTPTRLYQAGEEEICFVPKDSIMALKDKRIRSISFIIAIRPASGGDWLFLEGSGLLRNPQLLWTIFPKLSKQVTPPPNTMTLLK